MVLQSVRLGRHLERTSHAPPVSAALERLLHTAESQRVRPTSFLQRVEEREPYEGVLLSLVENGEPEVAQLLGVLRR